MRRSIEKLVDIGVLRYGSTIKFDVVYVIETFPGDQPSIQEVRGEVILVDKRHDLADLMGKELTLILKDGRRLRLSLTDAKGHFKGKGPIEHV